ncbi:hypothetical protein [Pyxidicoccus xibeiensis]|uniref:hypothetical protein n=1 Tax=Pyxidicoccus xibeiensis TaxID=2906759 RepID=UPI0020A76147|nr:hypothetical protein [Pyxidicoccus xibeiensis]MCP3138652.1 hypothetical protein [Pyxidicoccus xibeiensis]
MTDIGDAATVFFSDGVALDADTLVVSAGFTETPDAATSRLYLKFGDTWLAHEVAHDFITSVTHRSGVVCALGRNGLVKQVGEWGRPLTPRRVKGRFREYVITDAESRGPLERVRAVGDAFFACGWGGQLYRLESGGWRRLETGLDPGRDNDFLDLDGFASDDLYAVGLDGLAAHYDGSRWDYLKLPSRAHLHAVRCLPGGEVVVAGADGVLLQGSPRGWHLLETAGLRDDVWAICPFGRKLYLTAGTRGLHVYDGGTCSEVKVTGAENPPMHRLDASGGVLWSFGPRNVLAFDGQHWSEAVCPDNVPD